MIETRGGKGMGMTRFTDPDPEGERHDLEGHEGYTGNVLDDGSVVGIWTAELDPRIVGWCSACDCGWRGATTIRREGKDRTGWTWSPEMEQEWTEHTDPLLEALAKEHGVLSPARVADALEPVRTAIQEAGSLVAGALRGCEELATSRSGGDDVEQIRQNLMDAGRALGQAEVLSYPVRQHVGRLILERMESQSVTLWARWRVVDERASLVGLVAEERDWLGGAYGPVTFTAAHNPSGAAWGALWRTEGHDTPMAALAALAAHLRRLEPDGPPEQQA
jgi:hypothetical protein